MKKNIKTGKYYLLWIAIQALLFVKSVNGKCSEVYVTGTGLKDGYGSSPFSCTVCTTPYCSTCYTNNRKCESCYYGYLLDSAGNCKEINLALGKNTIQSSTLSDGLSKRAVDGITDSNFNHGSCTHTNLDQTAWWAVDLKDGAFIQHVRITNRDIAGERLSDFIVGVSVYSPWTFSPELSQSNICKQYTGYPPAGSTTDLFCDEAYGMYLFIMLTKPGYLTICEVEVYEVKLTRAR